MTSASAFGSWRSPLDARAIAAGVKGLQDLRAHNGVLYWLEARPRENGRTALMAREGSGTPWEVTPAPFNVRSRVHEYGGGAYLPCDDGIFFVNFADQRIYCSQNRHIEPVTSNDASLRFADLCLDTRRNRLIVVTEHHEGNAEAKTDCRQYSLVKTPLP